MDNKRAHFRIDYPPSERPSLFLYEHKTAYPVLDLSEKGVRFDCGDKLTLVAGIDLKATIQFKDGKAFAVSGKVVRFNQTTRQCAVRFSIGIPLQRMMEEHRSILKKYKGS